MTYLKDKFQQQGYLTRDQLKEYVKINGISYNLVKKILSDLGIKIYDIEPGENKKSTSIVDIPMIIQSSFKLNHSSFIEEIQRDMRVAIEVAKHILLFGYSLPEDDVIYRSLLAARKKYSEQGNIPYCSVATGRIDEIVWKR
ncbi:hypothetical protein SAMN04488598_10792 [Halanaerobium congolense]|jgi:hypothetical protein|uniref:Uncharacterized protein n=1 Tax=Halanaerobium congolense TaxID=54121 RepID=A0A1H9ZV94_9FIRM|nr:hypothetical protein [Halanaerobium congolense]PTX16415.1 hypothetical protein C7953_1132 [Halanaerobium congolense]SDF18524.1 hypothetical protein SAMN04488598_10792 [Halanaerobium congolense]SES85244.1 hypothetical protein SAMN04515652_10892 [Halanaerobium congolense]SFO94496.1 hypothetical protein SAMN04488596_10328 [Halanaerobium congolense]